MVTPSIKGLLIRILKMFLFPFLIEPFQKYHLKTNICHLSYRWRPKQLPEIIRYALRSLWWATENEQTSPPLCCSPGELQLALFALFPPTVFLFSYSFIFLRPHIEISLLFYYHLIRQCNVKDADDENNNDDKYADYHIVMFLQLYFYSDSEWVWMRFQTSMSLNW